MAQATRSEAYITISLDKSGRVMRVEQGGREIKPIKSQPGLSKRGDSAGECEEIIKILIHELLTCKKKESEPDPGSDPCCYRDAFTGDVYCWC